MPVKIQRLILQIVVALGACVPVAAGAWGIWSGQDMLGGHPITNIALDSHVRYLSGLLLGIGVAYWNMVPWIEDARATKYMRLLTLIIMIGGLGRLYAALLLEWPPLSMQLALVMELIVTPAVYLWQRHIAKRLVDVQQ
jgi:hypothetical protein